MMEELDFGGDLMYSERPTQFLDTVEQGYQDVQGPV
jgi:hypothetical protein